MIVVDGHCDTVTKVIDEHASLWNNSFHWDVQRAMEYNGFVQVMAIYQDHSKIRPSFANAIRYIQQLERLQKQTPSFTLCCSYDEIERGLAQNKVCGLLAIEGGEALEGSIENLTALYDAGVRILTLTWNYSNALGDGAHEAKHGGLTSFGREVVAAMQQKGMLIDISHANERTFYDCIAACKGPLIASHSNAAAIHEHPRNLRDEQIVEIARLAGVIGINLYTKFIREPESTITDVIRHIDHICSIAGDDTVAIGSDFDGCDNLPKPVKGVQHLYLLLNEMARLNYSQHTIEKIAGGNFLRVFRSVLRK